MRLASTSIPPRTQTDSPVYQDVVGGAVVLDLVHADPWYVVLRRPPDGGGGGRQVGHADPLLVGAGLTAAHVGLDGGGDVRGPGVGVQLGVKVRRGVDNQLDGGCGLSGGVGGDARELSRVLRAAKTSGGGGRGTR